LPVLTDLMCRGAACSMLAGRTDAAVRWGCRWWYQVVSGAVGGDTNLIRTKVRGRLKGPAERLLLYMQTKRGILL
jgi:hypothetical protein